jgi:hypothetical protein
MSPYAAAQRLLYGYSYIEYATGLRLFSNIRLLRYVPYAAALRLLFGGIIFW